MLTTKYAVLDRHQFQLLRLAKQLIKQEFNQDLTLQDKHVMDRLYEFAMESADEQLYDIFQQLKPSNSEGLKSTPTNTTSSDTSRIKVGDIIDGKRCTAIYRGKPVFE